MKRMRNSPVEPDGFEIIKRSRDALSIRLTGPCAQIPSSSNTHVVCRFGKRYGLRKSDRTLGTLHALTALYQKWLYESGESPPYFGSDPIRIIIKHAYKPRRFDSHNVPKAACDWLQSVNIIDDDTFAECFCIKAQDYPDRCNQNETIIRIVRRSRDDAAWDDLLLSS